MGATLRGCLCLHFLEMENLMKKLFNLIYVFMLLILFGCSNVERYDEVADIYDSQLGVLDDTVSLQELQNRFPEAEIKSYDKLLSLFLDIETGQCDVAILEQSFATQVLTRNRDYGSLGTLAADGDDDALSVIVPQSMIAMDNVEALGAEDWWSGVQDKVYRNLFAEEAWQLILGGLYTTVVIFVFAALFAVLLGSFLAYMAINHKWPWLYRPLSWFVLTIHDVPSVVLMMFFYYVLFAGQMNGILVSIIALGVYTSGSLYKIFKIHILQIGREQLEAGRVLGLTSSQCYRYIILPQAAKTMLPLVIAELKLQLRATSYAGYIAQKDLVKAVDAIRALTFDAFVPLLIISILYLILSWLIARVINLLYENLFNHD